MTTTPDPTAAHVAVDAHGCVATDDGTVLLCPAEWRDDAVPCECWEHHPDRFGPATAALLAGAVTKAVERSTGRHVDVKVSGPTAHVSAHGTTVEIYYDPAADLRPVAHVTAPYVGPSWRTDALSHAVEALIT